MSTTPSRGGADVARRRSQRVILSLPITVRTEDGAPGAPFEEHTHTLVVNVHGALILLAAKVVKGQRLLVTLRTARETQVCRVVNFGPTKEDKTQIGIEFLNPSPDFWHISFPPEDWVQPEPSSIAADNE